jgi:hypothetical protein
MNTQTFLPQLRAVTVTDAFLTHPMTIASTVAMAFVTLSWRT